MVTLITPMEVQEGSVVPLDAMTIVARQNQQLHEKILRLRALREESEANSARVTRHRTTSGRPTKRL